MKWYQDMSKETRHWFWGWLWLAISCFLYQVTIELLKGRISELEVENSSLRSQYNEQSFAILANELNKLGR